MNGILYKLFTGMLNPSENIKVDSEEFKVALSKLIGSQTQLKETMSEEQLSLFEEMSTQKNLTLAFEMFEAFRAGVKLTYSIWEEIIRE